MKTLQECLADYDVAMLRAIAERRGVELDTDHRPTMIETLNADLLERASVEEALTWLDREERQALEFLMAAGGRMRMHRFERVAGTIRKFGPGRLAREAPWRSPVSAAEGLWYRGMISRAFAQEADTVVEFAFVPNDLRALLPIPPTAEQPFTVPDVQAPHRVVQGDSTAADDVCTLLTLAQAGALESKEGSLFLEADDAIFAQFLVPDQDRLSFLYRVAEAAGLIKVRGRVVQVARDQARAWLKDTRPEQMRILQEAWRGDTEWNDLWHVSGIVCEATGWRNDPVAGRAAVLALLARCERDVWLSIPGFVDVVRDQAPDYLRPDGDFDSWYIRDSRSGAYLTGFDHWDRIEGALLRYLIAGPLHWLGLVAVGYQEGWEKPSAFRLSAWGAAFLGAAVTELEILSSGSAQVSPEATVTMTRGAPLSERFQLARIAEWQAAGTEYVYAITARSLGKALSEGIEVPQIEHFLRRISADHVPAAAIGRIRAWAGQYGHVRLRRAALLEARNGQVMSELWAHERIRSYLRQALSPTVALVRESDWEILTKELYRAGYLPEIIDR
jgi:hypothetical protein